MADNFNFKNFLLENKLGAYSKLKEGPQPGTMTPSDWSKVYTGTPQTGGDPYADFRVLTTPIDNVIPIEYKRDRKDRGWQYMAIPKKDLARRLRNGYLQLPTGDNYLIGKEMEALLNQLATGEST